MRLIGVILFFCCLSCAIKKKVSSNQKVNNSFEQQVQSVLGDKYVYKEKGAYSLSYSKSKDFKSLFQNIHFIIFDHTTSEIILQDSLENGKVHWKTDVEIEAFANVKGTDGRYIKVRYTFNVLTRTKIEL